MEIPSSRRPPRRWTLERGDAVLAAILATASYAFAAWKLAALSWDGSWYLFSTLQHGVPFVANGRYGNYPILWLMVQVSGVLRSSVWVGTIYGGLLTLFPLGSLGLSWWFLRGEAYRRLRIWPLLGILLGALPGQLCLVSEATLVAQLLWPILAIAVTGPRTRTSRALLSGLALLAALLHPTAILIFGLVSGFFAWRAWQRPIHRSGDLAWSAVFVVLALGKMIESYLFASGYERNQVSWRAVYWQCINSVWGYPLVFLGLAGLLGLGLLWPGQFARGRWCALLCLGMGGVGLLWASDVSRWSGLLDYRRFVLPAMLPWVGLAAWHATRSPETKPPPGALSGVAAVFCVVFTTQLWVWNGLIDRLASELSRRSLAERYVTAEELPFTRGTPLRHWSATPLSILLQGPQPRAIYVLRRQCILPHSIFLYDPDDLPLSDGWFALSPLAVVGTPAR